jgi:hypothetical protein
MRGQGGGGGCVVSANEYGCAHGAQINFGDLTPGGMEKALVRRHWMGGTEVNTVPMGLNFSVPPYGYYNSFTNLGFNALSSLQNLTVITYIG